MNLSMHYNILYLLIPNRTNVMEARPSMFCDTRTAAPMSAVSLAASTVSISVPQSCSSQSQTPTNMTLEGKNYYLLPGLKFDNPSCCPNITDMTITGTGPFSITLLQIRKGFRYWIDASRPLQRTEMQNRWKIQPPFQVQCTTQSALAVAVHCNSDHQDCVFNRTEQKSALRSGELRSTWYSYSQYLYFGSGRYSYHPMFSLSLSRK